MLGAALKIVESSLAASSAEAASRSFFTAAGQLGASYLQTRLYRRPIGVLTSGTHWAAGGFVARLAVPGWVGSPAFDYVCFEHNPLLGAIRQGLTHYRFSDFAPHREKGHGEYWQALSEARIGEALCATAYGAGRRVASLHLGFDDPPSPEHAAAIHLAGSVLVEKLLSFEGQPPDAELTTLPLTVRERDSLAFVAEGKTDWEIGAILGISEATARFHVDNARRKLGAVNRAHAVARLVSLGLI